LLPKELDDKLVVNRNFNLLETKTCSYTLLEACIYFETQSFTITCELICNIIPLQLCVCDLYLLNHAILVVKLIYQGLSWHSADYRVYLSESKRVSMC
jgi:hypothetical protein